MACHDLRSYVFCQFNCFFVEFLPVVCVFHLFCLNRGLSWAEKIGKKATNTPPSILNLNIVLCEQSAPFVLLLLLIQPHIYEFINIHRCVIVLVRRKKQVVGLFAWKVDPQVLQNSEKLITVEIVFQAGS